MDKISGKVGIYTSKYHRHTKFIVNSKHLYFWDKKTLKFFDLQDELIDTNLKTVGLSIDPDDP